MTGVTKVSRSFLNDFAFCANYYKWNESDIDEMKAEVRKGKGMREYLETLAEAHRDGYEQTRENRFIRLHVWLAGNSPNHKAEDGRK